jgi:hypothetical protein
LILIPVTALAAAPRTGTPTAPGLRNALEWANSISVGGFFAKLTRRRLKRGVFEGIADLQAAISRFLRQTNAHPKPFVWTADPDTFLRQSAAARRISARPWPSI